VEREGSICPRKSTSDGPRDGLTITLSQWHRFLDKAPRFWLQNVAIAENPACRRTVPQLFGLPPQKSSLICPWFGTCLSPDNRYDQEYLGKLCSDPGPGSAGRVSKGLATFNMFGLRGYSMPESGSILQWTSLNMTSQ